MAFCAFEIILSDHFLGTHFIYRNTTFTFVKRKICNENNFIEKEKIQWLKECRGRGCSLFDFDKNMSSWGSKSWGFKCFGSRFWNCPSLLIIVCVWFELSLYIKIAGDYNGTLPHLVWFLSGLLKNDCVMIVNENYCSTSKQVKWNVWRRPISYHWRQKTLKKPLQTQVYFNLRSFSKSVQNSSGW